MKTILAALLFALLSISEGAPFSADIEIDPEQGDYFEGDIILDVTRNGERDPQYRWPRNTVHYRITNSHFDSDQINLILRSMRTIEAVSCIRFMEAPHNQKKGYLTISGNSKGCSSSVGFNPKAVQRLSLNKGCFGLGIIVHELLHTLGFWHMHTTPKRDNYVRIVDKNILDDKKHNFKKYDHKKLDDFGEEYDYGSIMHYHAKEFTKNGLPTIEPLKQLPPGVVMGQRTAMSTSDINRLNKMYRCPPKI